MSAVGVITLSGNFNYGNKLQLYSVTCIWKAMGFEPVVLTCSELNAVQQTKNVIKSILRGNTNSADDLRSPQRAEAFNRFNCHFRYVHMSSSKEISCRNFDYVSVGSDQVWNPYYALNKNWFFLRYVEPSKRIAFCPSIGINSLPRKYHRRYAAGLKGFNKLSIREDSGAAIINSLTGQKATVLLDPTFLLSPEEWSAVADTRLVPQKPYGFAYILGEEHKQQDELLSTLDRRYQSIHIRISDRDSEGQLPAGPAEFISLVENAEYIVTNSFHACVFAVLFDKPLYVLPRIGEGAMCDRIETMVRKLALCRIDFEGSGIRAERYLASPNTASHLRYERDLFFDFLDKTVAK